MRTLLFTFVVTFYSFLSFAQQFDLEATLEKNIRAIFDIDGDGKCEYIADTNKVYDGATHLLKYTLPAGRYIEWNTGTYDKINPYAHFIHTDFNSDGKRDLITGDGIFTIMDVVNNTILFELNKPGESIHIKNLIDIDGDGELELVLTAYITSSSTYKTYIYSTGIINSATERNDVDLLKEFRLQQNFPNPFNPSTTIQYTISSPEKVSIRIYDVSGQLIKEINKEHNWAGEYEVVWDGKNNFGQRVSSGAYFYQIMAGNYVEAKKMIMLK